MTPETTDRRQQERESGSPGGAGGSSGIELAVVGMSCSNCARHVTEAIQKVPGVASAIVNLEGGRASIRWAAGAAPDVPAVLRAVTGAGYQARVREAQAEQSCHDGGETHVAGWERTLWVGVGCTLFLMLGEWVFAAGLQPWFRWLAFGLASIVQVVGGARFYRGAWRQLKAGNSNMDTLVALGSTTAFSYSVWFLFSGGAGHLYFMESAAIITLVSIGHWLEARVTSAASTSVRALLNLAPSLARRRLSDGSESEVPVAELRKNDLVVLRPGDRVPIDGEVREGNSAVDESTLTGESMPMEKGPGAPICAGTINLNGLLLVRVTATGEETALAHIIATVQRAQTSRANIQRLGDRVSSVFVPVVIGIAVAAGLWWGLAPAQAHGLHEWLAGYLWAAHPPSNPLAAAFIAAAAVLIVACPCAMGLATPAAIMAGSNAAALRGILIRDGVALEKAGQITSVLLDKTGTLTVGKPAVVQVETFPGAAWDESRRRRSGEAQIVLAAFPDDRDGMVRKVAAALARPSNHPLSQAIAKLSPEELPFTDWQEVRGSGVQAKCQIEDGEWAIARLGSFPWLAECGVDLAAGNALAEEWEAQGATILGLGLGHGLAALFALKDTLKPGAVEVVRDIHRMGLTVSLVTGDNPRTAASIARQAGISPQRVFAQVRPEQKAELIRTLQRQGERVAFVGDGINDAPALEEANLGIAVARASDVAREAADIILLRSELEAIPESIGLARAALQTIKQNLFWAFFYNAAGVPLAALGFLSPVLCAAAMGFSDLIVIGNALRLSRWKRSSRAGVSPASSGVSPA